jgi:hypothetical protein
MTIKRVRCCGIWECRSERSDRVIWRSGHRVISDLRLKILDFELKAKSQELIFGDNSKESQRRKEAQVLRAQAQPLQDLRTPARLSAEVRRMPLMFPRPGAARRDTRGFEVVLVGIVVRHRSFVVRHLVSRNGQ